MVTCRFILHGDLPDLVGGRPEVPRRLPAPTSLGDALAALGIPHGEIGRVRRDGATADLGDLLADGACVEAWPAEPRELPDPRFLCDLHLGKLARLLRFCGFDTRWEPDLREPALAGLAGRERRTVLSRHRALLKRRVIESSLLVRSDHADRQLTEVLRRFRLAERIVRPGRCPVCNGTLVAVAKSAVRVPIPPRTAAWLDDYWLCSGCGQLFWEGTHVQRLRDRVSHAAAAARK